MIEWLDKAANIIAPLHVWTVASLRSVHCGSFILQRATPSRSAAEKQKKNSESSVLCVALRLIDAYAAAGRFIAVYS